MCGFASWVDFNIDLKEQSDALLKMSASLSRRGPDAGGNLLENCAALIHRRLIVVDPEGGAQPMTEKAKGETYTLVYNGELYNTEDIRRELKILGYSFFGHSDTEVLLKAYIEWGADCLQKLNGIFAFAVWHQHAKKLFCARDRIGVKPLFFYKYDGGLIAASEIKTLMANPIVPPQIDDFGLKQILLLGPGRSGGSGVVKDIKELLPGEFLEFDKTAFKVSSYWRLKAYPHADDLQKTVEQTRELICDAVRRQLVSDVPLSCFLSGGLDSSIISFIAAEDYKVKGKTLTTYSVDFFDNEKYFVKSSFQPDPDNRYISLMSDFIKSDHISIVLDNLKTAEAIEDAADARDLPGMADIDSSLLLFCKEIKERDTVCLSGECADEIFGGYPWYHDTDILFCDSFPWSTSTEFRKKLFNRPFIGSDCDDFVKAEYQKTLAFSDYLDADDALNRRMREMFALNFYSFMQTLLDRKDRMSMYNGLEVRVPFCDYRLVEYAFNMPWEYKSLNGREKGVVREAFKGILPDEIVHRKKSPYPKTFSPVFLDYVKNMAWRLCHDTKSVLYELVNKDFLRQLYDDKIRIQSPWYGQLMRGPQVFAYLVQIDCFFKKFNLKIVD